MRRMAVCLTSLAVLSWLPAHAAGAPEGGGEWLGRRNPFRPLIAPRQDVPPMPPSAPGGLALPLPAQSREAEFAYVGLVYDEAEAIAAVSDGQRTRFVRLGDRLDAGTVSAITPQQLTLSRKGRTLVLPMRREGVN